MILGANTSSNVCLRCQKCLLRTLLSPGALLLPPRRLPRGVRLQHNEARPETPQINPRAHDIPQEYHDERRRDSSLPVEESPTTSVRWFKMGKNQLTRHPFGRLYGIRGHQVREDTVELDVSSLGAPSEVIVLRDSKIRAVPSKIEDAGIPDRVDILAQLDAERGLTSQSEVNDNIELLMPKGGAKALSWKELRAIQDHLFRGFTVAQLVKYIHSYDIRSATARSPDKNWHKAGPLSSIRRKTTWMAGISETGAKFEENHQRGYGSEAFTHKQQLVLLLLRKCWGLEVQEVTESIGEMELKLEQRELELLIKGRNPPLKLIIDQLISNREETIEAFRSRAVIRITAPKEKCDIIVNRILNVLQDVQHLEVNLEALLSSPQSQIEELRAYQDDILDELARLTETEITRLSDSKVVDQRYLTLSLGPADSNKLCISSLSRNPRTSLSTPADVARRLLLTSSDVADRNTIKCYCAYTLPPFLSTKYQFTDGMSWQNRRRNWLRWTSPVPKLPPRVIDDRLLEMETTSVIGESDHDISKGLDDHRHQSSAWPPGIRASEIEKQNAVQVAPEGAFWDQNCDTSTSAIVGHILFAVPSAQEAAIENLELAVPGQVIFKPATVNLSRLLSSMKQPITSMSPSLIMRFVPSPWTAEGAASLAKFPHIEMNFAVDAETKELTLEKLAAVVESDASDLMLLESGLDLRFQQRSTACLRTLNYHQLPQIKAFLEASQLDIRRGQLETPPGLSLPVPVHLCRLGASGPSNHSVAKSLDVHYLFAGLEYRNTIVFNFDGWELNYTSIEGGKADGRRGELSLLPRRLQEGCWKEQDGSATLQEQQTEKFINAAYRLINKLNRFSNPAFPQVPGTTPVRMIKATDWSQCSDFQLFKRPIDFKG